MIPFKDKNGTCVNARGIRESLGDFSKDETRPAKMAARMARKHPSPCKRLIDLILVPHYRGVHGD